MLTRIFKIISFITILFNSLGILAQGVNVEDIEPFCAGSKELVFANTSGDITDFILAEDGPYYGCVEYPKYPSWYYIKIENSGDLEFVIAQYENADSTGDTLDVDFVLWGPFEEDENFNDPYILTEEKMVDCSYAPDAVEIANIFGAKENEIYVFAILNFDGRSGHISFQQTNTNVDKGSTNCNILDDILGGDKALCGIEEVDLDASQDDAVGYHWFYSPTEDGDFASIENGDTSKITISKDGFYKVVVDVGDGENKYDKEDVVKVNFYSSPIVETAQPPIYVCENQRFVDITQYEANLIANYSQEKFNVEYFESEAAVLKKQIIANPEALEVNNNKSIFARVQEKSTGCYSDVVEFSLVMTSMPDDFLNPINRVCVNNEGDLLDPIIIGKDLGGDFKYVWYHNDQKLIENAQIIIDHEIVNPEYQLIITNLNTGCEKQFLVNMEYVSEPQQLDIKIHKGDFGSYWDVEAIAKRKKGHLSNFEYSLDGAEFTENARFKNLSRGLHNIAVREKSGCGITLNKELMVIGYDFFFTPNNDGYNDYWSVSQHPDYKVQSIQLFDRYGRFLKSIDPEAQGWDGRAEGRLLPEDDYWFRLEYIDVPNNRRATFSGHLTLKRSAQ